ncbi:MAG: L,D-transpeptidase/peptidoglycan binding protein [Clostridiales bacterium]|nr:L,D-transpeptidase/peptidoglycan binding protein [Clostridiales bacterium]
MRRRRILIAALAALAVIYIWGCFYYSRHFYGGGTVFGIAIRGQTVESLKEEVREKIGSYSLTIQTRDGEETITAEAMGLEYDDQEEIDALFAEQTPALWFLMFRTTKDDLDVAMTIDERMLGEAVGALSCMQTENMTAPTDAYLEYEDGAFVVRAETYGNQLEYDTVYPVIYDAVFGGDSVISLDELSCYVAPEVYSDTEGLLTECDEVNRAAAVEITYDFSDRTMVVDGSMIAEWIVFGEDFSWSLDEEAIADYIYEMAYETDTFGLTHTFTTSYGSEITLKGGDYGWCINQSQTVEQLVGLIQAGESVTTEPVYRYSGICRDTDDIGDSYVEVCISTQTMWVYSEGECVVTTSVVTGDVAKGYDTPSGGVWAIDARLQDYMMTGQDYDVEVSYWLPFNGNVGIHDAAWRSEFGGDIYKTNGSHGCVNTPVSAMKTVYEYVQIGWPVIVY